MLPLATCLVHWITNCTDLNYAAGVPQWTGHRRLLNVAVADGSFMRQTAMQSRSDVGGPCMPGRRPAWCRMCDQP